MCCVTKAGSYLRRIDSCITQLKAQGPSRTCNDSKEEEEEEVSRLYLGWFRRSSPLHCELFPIPWVAIRLEKCVS